MTDSCASWDEKLNHVGESEGLRQVRPWRSAQSVSPAPAGGGVVIDRPVWAVGIKIAHKDGRCKVIEIMC